MVSKGWEVGGEEGLGMVEEQTQMDRRIYRVSSWTQNGYGGRKGNHGGGVLVGWYLVYI